MAKKLYHVVHLVAGEPRPENVEFVGYKIKPGSPHTTAKWIGTPDAGFVPAYPPAVEHVPLERLTLVIDIITVALDVLATKVGHSAIVRKSIENIDHMLEQIRDQGDLVDSGFACTACGECRRDYLSFMDDTSLMCNSCGHEFTI